MTDAAVKVNGVSAGPVHQGGFYRFKHDITSLVKFGEGAANDNLLEVEVAKVSADPLTELAERGGDYWVFGGIFRPVWLEAMPAAAAIDQVAIDARADGSITADVVLSAVPSGRIDGLTAEPLRLEAQVLNAEGAAVGVPLAETLTAGGSGRVRLTGRLDAPKTWNAESPNLYGLRVSLRRGTEVVHLVKERFGFRTFEVRDGQGLFLNGQRILLKGVDRHSFRPETGRALNPEDCYEDVRLMRGMNMNAVRMSHYPPDPAFLEACDELGLYVLDELSGWQHAHGTPIGRLLVREMVERDVNHPSILFWDNGNEGGFNRDLDGEFALYDLQRRRVLHPWDTFGGIDTKHYPGFAEFVQRLRGPNLVMPTEILHGLYDGGMGSGLEDYWRALAASPVGAGMFSGCCTTRASSAPTKAAALTCSAPLPRTASSARISSGKGATARFAMSGRPSRSIHPNSTAPLRARWPSTTALISRSFRRAA
jgi:beta-galactosidase/beta-glucuronidase